jgi:hypothetical protein
MKPFPYDWPWVTARIRAKMGNKPNVGGNPDIDANQGTSSHTLLPVTDGLAG